jgi:hypothetical protein
MRNLLLISLILLGMITISCSVSYNSPKQNDYKANLHKDQFFMNVPEIMNMENFKVTENNENEGVLKFKKNVIINENHAVEFNIEFKFNDTTRIVNSLVKAVIFKNKITNVEYYNIECYREEYKVYFLKSLETIKNYCTQVSFRNPPGN